MQLETKKILEDVRSVALKCADNKLTEIDRVKLEGRIYPAIQSCVGNRYKILLGIFAYYGFLFSQSDKLGKLGGWGWIKSIDFYVDILFVFCVIHNLYNYYQNAKEENSIESKYDENSTNACKSNAFWKKIKSWIWKLIKLSTMELLFLMVAFALIFFAHWKVLPKLYSDGNTKETSQSFITSCDR